MPDTFHTINPATGAHLNIYPAHSQADGEAAAKAAYAAFTRWRESSFAERSRVFIRAAEILLERRQAFAQTMADEMGKPVTAGIAEIEKCAGCCRFYAEHAEKLLADEPVITESSKAYVTFQPLGVVLGVMPWNFPFWQVFRFAVPTLMAGNAALLKHASNTPGCALAIEDILNEAGLPKGLFKALLIGSDGVPALIADNHVRAVSLTGSTQAGRAVAAQAGMHLKKAVLELGGSDAYIVLADADLERAARLCAESRLLNAGQSCIAAKRFIVEETVAEEFTRRLRGHFLAAKMGDPRSTGTTLGPLARADLRDQLHDQVRRSIARGARLVTGGEIPKGSGAFYPPTILTDVVPGMPAFDEELFGPVAAIVTVKSEAQAIALANLSPYGLGGGVFTTDAARGERIARSGIESGSCFVNAYVRSDVRLPFGGVKDSGYGRELSYHGIREFTNIKAVSIA